MKYFSTRGGQERLSFEETVLAGLAPNGGLYIPEHIPSLPPDWKSQWKSHSFVQLSVAVLSLYISPDEMSTDELTDLARRSYAGFRHPDVTPLRRMSANDGTFVLELFHGPTFAFKDVALQLLGNLFEFFLARRNRAKPEGSQVEKLTVVGATSGDTGSAAIYGLRNKENISIFILHPKGRVSPIQEAQMTTITDANVHNVAVKGTFDDCQDIVKSLFADREFNARHHLGAVNSINWARILAQMVYYFQSYFHVASQLLPSDLEDLELQYVVPTGNFGDVLAGYYAKRMGLPMGKLAIATNENDILARFWRSGRYEKEVVVLVDSSSSSSAAGTAAAAPPKDATASAVKETLSPAMDILVSSNFERLLWYLAFENADDDDDDDAEERKRDAAGRTVAGWMLDVKNEGRMEVPANALETARRDFFAERVSDELTLNTIRTYFEEEKYIADPHTAVGLAAARIVASHNSPRTYQIVLSTAHPAKFSEAVSKALSQTSDFKFERDVLPQELKGLLEKERRVVDVPRADVALVKEVIERHAL